MTEVMHWMAFAQNQIQFGLQWARGIVLKLKTGDMEETQKQGRLRWKFCRGICSTTTGLPWAAPPSPILHVIRMWRNRPKADSILRLIRM